MRSRGSLRAHLALTYAGIAALTAVILGGILLGVLGEYYARTETQYLQAGSRRVLEQGLPSVDASQSELARWALSAAIVAQARVKLYAEGGTLLADSGSLQNLDPSQLGERGHGERREREGLPRPLGEGFIGRGGQPSSSRTLKVVPGPDGYYGGYLVFSEAPASGSDALRSVGQTWALAALLAVVLAAGAGYWVSARISRPVLALTDASDRMAEGELSARAPVERDDEIGRLAESFNSMAARIETTVVALRRFVAAAAFSASSRSAWRAVSG
ncbi:MAG: HAMP domain-containing protein, partial [Actinobacteria bacterium]